MIATYSSWNKQPIEKLLTSLSESNGAHPYISRNVKIHEFKSEVIRYCNNFQERKCKFREKCRYKHEINPNFKKEDILLITRIKIIYIKTIKIRLKLNRIHTTIIIKEVIIIIIHNNDLK